MTKSPTIRIAFARPLTDAEIKTAYEIVDGKGSTVQVVDPNTLLYRLSGPVTVKNFVDLLTGRIAGVHHSVSTE